ncbi:imm11 family protein [Dehalogenimonas etheniformans]|uniref:Immunity MXAN-0049 protein domain-containing protein n=1 Tax=Dehalogenimonas etheniformans TaxID=1536648 RepID=A0A2P5PA55_9CHLR|nr:DUF1629 domain-containing protein [Dehalogenimonas etheniformans]PPD59155.1 hypothetical protein JP09_000295 [Dehalogenimonas etheniformans]QNT75801.1 hypothetical protein HX448_03410 [Dehalogenimonas etheniformans]
MVEMKLPKVAKPFVFKLFAGGPVWPKLGGVVFTGKNDLKGFDEYRFYEGKLIDDWPPGITFYVKGTGEEDYILVGIHWIVVSDRVKTKLEECGVFGVQFLPITVVNDENGEKLGPYWALNVFQEVDALDWEHTRWINLGDKPEDTHHPLLGAVKVALRFDKVNNIDIFRLNIKGRGDTTIYLSRRVRDCLTNNRFTGLEIDPVATY